MYRPEKTGKWLYKHTHTHADLSCLLADMKAWSDFYTHRFVEVGIFNGEVVQHLGVYCCHGYNWHLVIRLIPHWSIQCDNGAVVLYFNNHLWWTEAS